LIGLVIPPNLLAAGDDNLVVPISSNG